MRKPGNMGDGTGNMGDGTGNMGDGTGNMGDGIRITFILTMINNHIL